MTERRFAVLGTMTELAAVGESADVEARVLNEWSESAPDASVWISEGALRMSGKASWPTTALLAATGDGRLITRTARAFGVDLRARGYAGVFGDPGGALSDHSVLWSGGGVCEAAAQGFREAGIRVAVFAAEEDGWRVDGLGFAARVAANPSAGTPESCLVAVAAPDLERARAEGPKAGISDERIFEGTLDSSGPDERLEAELARAAITLIDDPAILPLRPEYGIAVYDPLGLGVAEAFGAVWSGPVKRVEGKNGFGLPLLWVDGEGPTPEDGQPLVAIGCSRLEFLAECPAQSAKIAVYESRPAIWRELARKLSGQDLWLGRLPVDIGGVTVNQHNSHYTTEQPHPHPAYRWLDTQSAEELLGRFIAEEEQALKRLQAVVPIAAQVIEALRTAWRDGRRLFYVGAGSAGRAGMLDAAELPPTFGVTPEVAIPILAGGATALGRAKEGAEDDFDAGRDAVREYGISEGDVLLAISAHGDTPFVMGAVSGAREAGAVTVALVNNRGTKLAQVCDYVVEIPSGPEFLVGSTRLKAGTAEKVLLNAFSTIGMIGLGKTYDNLMIDFNASNRKLKERALRVFSMATGRPRKIAVERLAETGGNLKEAIVMELGGVSTEQARQLIGDYRSVTRVLRSLGRLAP